MRVVFAARFYNYDMTNNKEVNISIVFITNILNLFETKDSVALHVLMNSDINLAGHFGRCLQHCGCNVKK